jgi:amino acid adenylation domain-containing protein
MPHQIPSPLTKATSARSSNLSLTIALAYERIAAARPDSVALVFGNDEITYEELNSRANRIARYLLRGHLESKSRKSFIAVYFDRSPDMVTAMLAILKAGWAYLPIDSTYPAARILEMVEDACPIAILTSAALATRLGHELNSLSVPIVAIDKLDAELAQQSDNNLSPQSEADDLAYLMYTSGSTGKPKGVMVTHRNVIRLLEQTNPWFGFSHKDVWTLFHSIAFDFSVWEIWGCLLTGGRLIIVTFETSRSPDDFRELLRSQRVTVLNQTPSAFSLLLQSEAGCASKLEHLRFIVFGGERLEYRMLLPWFERYADTAPQLVNMYGITETTVHVTYRKVTALDAKSTKESLIGVPIPDLQLHVLDESCNPVASGDIGEIYVGGGGVTSGYLNRPELTRERFVPDPFSQLEDARLYRTGDLARLRSDGEIVYLGRNDNQVKINGFRIELGEIETALAQCHGLSQSAVSAIQDGNGNQRLAAYYVVAHGASHTSRSLSTHLSERLPAHMRPSFYVRLDALPLTHNGKLDRTALPQPDSQPIGITIRKPLHLDNLTEMERLVTEVWCDLLGAASVDRNENLFDIGATSLLLIQAHSRLRTRLNRQFSVTWMFEYPTVRSLADRLSTDAPTAPSANLLQERAQQQRNAFARARAARFGAQ